MSTRLPLETQTLYAELTEHLLTLQARRSVGSLSGSFTRKTVKGERYLYFQASLPGGTTKQLYLGRNTPGLDRLVGRFERERVAMEPDLERVTRLAAQLRAGGANVTDAPSARVIRALADGRVFDAGGVLVGTHAFGVLGNLMGRRWASGALRTQDVDIGRSREPDVAVAVTDVDVDVPSVLESLKMGFLPVPPLDPKHPSTSFKVRGQGLRVDLLCPGRTADERPVSIRRFRAAAQPLRFLDYLLESPERAPVLNGGAMLVNVPAPARFALHKLVVARLRPAALQTKAEKDIAQASELLEALVEDRPEDVALAWAAAIGRGPGWREAFQRGLGTLKRRRPGLAAKLAPLVPPSA